MVILSSGAKFRMLALDEKYKPSRIWADLVSREKSKAHRVAWSMWKGEIPDGMMVLHRCDVRSCINPNHLFLGHAKDNTDDMVLKNRAPNRKLTVDDVLEIRRRKRSGETYASMAAEFGISDGTCRQAGRGKNWSAVK